MGIKPEGQNRISRQAAKNAKKVKGVFTGMQGIKSDNTLKIKSKILFFGLDLNPELKGFGLTLATLAAWREDDFTHLNLSAFIPCIPFIPFIPVENVLTFFKPNHQTESTCAVKQKSHILVVDDEQSMREFLTIMLQREGYHVDCAEDGEAAQRLLVSSAYDLVLSDIRMPNMGGIDLLHHIHQLGVDTPVIMMTAFSTTEQAVEAMKLGAYDYVMKPFKNDEIRLIVKHALEHRSLKQENQRLKKEFSHAIVIQAD